MSVSLVALLLSAAVPAILYFLLTITSNKKRPAPPQHNHGRTRTLPPSPWSLPLLGHLHLLGPLPHRALRSLATAHGPVMLLRLGRVPTVVASSAAAAEEAMRARDLDFASRPRVAVADRLLYGCRDVAFAPYGERWRQARRVCVSHLLSARRVLSFRRVREQEAAALVARVRERRGAAAVGDLGELLAAYANAVVSRAAFGDESARGLYGGGGGDDVDKGRGGVVKAVEELHHLLGTEPIGELLPWLSWVDTLRGLEGRIRWTFEVLDGALEKVIDDHRRRPPRDDGEGDHWDFVDVLLDVGKNDEYGIRLETAEIKAIILDMLAAGTNTTNTAMEWAMAELVTHPFTMRRLQDEIRAAVGSAGSVSEDHLHKLPYLKAVIRETLRLHVPVPLLVPRETVRDTELLGYQVPAGTRVLINAWAIHRDPEAWGEDAEEFVPERFVGCGGVDDDPWGKDFALLPFGAGRRGCPGVGFAEPTIELAVASLLYHFDWEVAGGKALDMTEMSGITVHIKSGLPLVGKQWEP